MGNVWIGLRSADGELKWPRRRARSNHIGKRLARARQSVHETVEYFFFFEDCFVKSYASLFVDLASEKRH